jgi:predicted anti-sigma-YlaC factor YlaD
VFNKKRIPMGCRKYEARLEDYLQGAPDSELDEHLRRCSDCSAALDNSRVAGDLIREAYEPASEPHPAFLAGVLARIREEELRAESPAAFWSPLEFLASRLSMTAAVLLLALSAYLVGFAPRREPATQLPNRTELSASDFPQPPSDPGNDEEVLVSLAERHYGH